MEAVLAGFRRGFQTTDSVQVALVSKYDCYCLVRCSPRHDMGRGRRVGVNDAFRGREGTGINKRLRKEANREETAHGSTRGSDDRREHRNDRRKEGREGGREKRMCDGC